MKARQSIESTGYAASFGKTNLAIGVRGKADISQRHSADGDIFDITSSSGERAIVYRDTRTQRVGVLVDEGSGTCSNSVVVDVGGRAMRHRVLDPNGSWADVVLGDQDIQVSLMPGDRLRLVNMNQE